MSASSLVINAAIRAIHGEPDVNDIVQALHDEILARIIALAPGTYPVVRAVAALSGGMTALLDESDIADPALHDALARLIGTQDMRKVFWRWAEIAPAGWGRAYRDALVDGVRTRMHPPRIVAALIGPSDDAAALLTESDEVAFAIRRWGQSSPDAPTAWMDAISSQERVRLLTMVRSDPYAVAICMPWLPPDRAKRARINNESLVAALDAFADASSAARAQHAAVVKRMVARARSMDLWGLTRLACAVQDDDVWQRVHALVQEHPFHAYRIVTAAPWNNLAERVRNAILDSVAESDICAAVAAARGRTDSVAATPFAVTSFFAALDPDVWDALDDAAKRRWRDALPVDAAHLAVRSLGLRPEILARAPPDNLLIQAARYHVHDRTKIWNALLPSEMRFISPNDAYDLIAALQAPPADPSAFLCIAGGYDDPDVFADVRDSLHNPSDLALAVALQRCGDPKYRVHLTTKMIEQAQCKRTWDVVRPIMTIVLDGQVERLAHPDRREQMRQTLAHLTSLPPEISMPAFVALHRPETWQASNAAETLAKALLDHGDIFLALMDALIDDLRAVLLPLPKHAALADALRKFARNNPPVAQRLAYALRDHSWNQVYRIMLMAPPHYVDAVWRALDDAAYCAIADEIVKESQNTVDPVIIPDSIVALIRASWDTLPQDTQASLRVHPAFADLPQTQERFSRRFTRTR